MPKPPEPTAPERRTPRPRPAAARAATAPAEPPAEPDRGATVESAAPSTEAPGQPSGEPTTATTKRRRRDRTPKQKRFRTRIRGTRGLRIATRLLIIVVVLGAAALALRTYVIAPYYVSSQSMEPALHGGNGTNDRILVDKISYRVHDPHQGDIVVFHRPDTWKVADGTIVKRVIGLPGDIVTLRSGLVYVNGLALTENYLDKACGPAPTVPLTATSRWTVPEGDYFVMGDNRCMSDDSRRFGVVPRSKIIGRAFLIIWPLNRFGSP